MLNKQTASFYPGLTEMLKSIINDIAEIVLKEGNPIIMLAIIVGIKKSYLY